MNVMVGDWETIFSLGERRPQLFFQCLLVIILLLYKFYGLIICAWRISWYSLLPLLAERETKVQISDNKLDTSQLRALKVPAFQSLQSLPIDSRLAFHGKPAIPFRQVMLEEHGWAHEPVYKKNAESRELNRIRGQKINNRLLLLKGLLRCEWKWFHCLDPLDN